MIRCSGGHDVPEWEMDPDPACDGCGRIACSVHASLVDVDANGRPIVSAFGTATRTEWLCRTCQDDRLAQCVHGAKGKLRCGCRACVPKRQPKPKRVGLRARLGLVGMLLAVMFGASACDLHEDGSWRDGRDSGCLIPEWGCDGPLIDFGATSAPDPTGLLP